VSRRAIFGSLDCRFGGLRALRSSRRSGPIRCGAPQRSPRRLIAGSAVFRRSAAPATPGTNPRATPSRPFARLPRQRAFDTGRSSYIVGLCRARSATAASVSRRRRPATCTSRRPHRALHCCSAPSRAPSSFASRTPTSSGPRGDGVRHPRRDAVAGPRLDEGRGRDYGPYFQSSGSPLPRDGRTARRLRPRYGASARRRCSERREAASGGTAPRTRRDVRQDVPRAGSRRGCRLEASGAPSAIRFRVPPAAPGWPTRPRTVEFDHAHIEDFVVCARMGTTYHLCVVVDDIDMAITDVIRGDDHV